jgi:division protein CdvB (Snf7/Vps24/ESCRT-III family)
MAKLVMNARLALDQVALRIRTVTELGDIVSTLGPAIGDCAESAAAWAAYSRSSYELADIGNMLSGIMFDAGSGAGMTLNFDSVNEDAAKILSEAATVAEQRVSSNFPDLPTGISSNANKAKT